MKYVITIGWPLKKTGRAALATDLIWEPGWSKIYHKDPDEVTSHLIDGYANGIPFYSELASINGCWYLLFPGPNDDENALKAAKEEIYRDHDVVGMDTFRVSAWIEDGPGFQVWDGHEIADNDIVFGSLEAVLWIAKNSSYRCFVWPEEGEFKGKRFAFNDEHSDGFSPLLIDIVTANAIKTLWENISAREDEKGKSIAAKYKDWIQKSRAHFARMVELTWGVMV